MKTHKKLLIAAATEKELSGSVLLKNAADTDVFITGTGPFLPVYTLTGLFSEKTYDLVLFFGICGVYDSESELGEIYAVEKTVFSDCGIEDTNGGFIPLARTAFFDSNAFKMTDGVFVNPLAEKSGKKKAVCNTVCCCRTGKEYLAGMLKTFPADIETMESAAFALVCLNENQKFLEIRCSSNYVAPKSEKKWQVMPAIKKLGETIDYCLSSKILDSIC
jgi:nucleoside phosphorylase